MTKIMSIEFRQMLKHWSAKCDGCNKDILWGDFAYFIHVPEVNVVICKECYKEVKEKLQEIELNFTKKVRLV